MNAQHVYFNINGKSPAQSATPVANPVTVESARIFLLAMRSAGKRANDHGVMINAGREATEADQKSAIQAFTGKPVVGPLGAALDNANRMAQRVLRPVAAATTPYNHGATAMPSVAGYVAGMPSTESTKAALEAQERLLAEEIAAAVNSGKSTDALDSQLREVRRMIAAC